MAAQADKQTNWQGMWDAGKTGFHQPEVHPMLVKHFDRLFPDGPKGKVFVPLCGKSVDMKWFADQRITVVGVDIISKAFEEFFEEQSLDFSAQGVEGLENGFLYKSKDDLVRLYRCDIFDFNQQVEGQFSAVWDRASIIALNRSILKRYAEKIKSVLATGGRCLMELLEYDPASFDDLPPDAPHHPPPPFSTSVELVKSLYEPECSVEELQVQDSTLIGRKTQIHTVLVVKK